MPRNKIKLDDKLLRKRGVYKIKQDINGNIVQY